MALNHGKHVIKAASTTRTAIAVSSGVSEFYALVRGTAAALGMKSMARDYEHEIEVALETDSVSGRGMSPTAWRRKGATRGHSVFVGAGKVPQARRNDPENPRIQQ